MNQLQVNALHELSPIASSYGYPTVSSTALDAAALAAAANGVTLAANTGYLMVQPTTNPVRVTFDGTTPTASVGIELAAGSITYLSRAMYKKAQFIRSTGSDSVLQVAQLSRK